MKLLTLNTHSLIEPAYEAKRDAFVEFIRKEQPDVFALQEVCKSQPAFQQQSGDGKAEIVDGEKHRNRYLPDE